MNCAKSGYSRTSTMQWAWRSRGLIREQNDHLFLQSDEETLTCRIGAFVWRAIFGVGCLTALLENSDLNTKRQFF